MNIVSRLTLVILPLSAHTNKGQIKGTLVENWLYIAHTANHYTNNYLPGLCEKEQAIGLVRQ